MAAFKTVTTPNTTRVFKKNSLNLTNALVIEYSNFAIAASFPVRTIKINLVPVTIRRLPTGSTEPQYGPARTLQTHYTPKACIFLKLGGKVLLWQNKTSFACLGEKNPAHCNSCNGDAKHSCRTPASETNIASHRKPAKKPTRRPCGSSRRLDASILPPACEERPFRLHPRGHRPPPPGRALWVGR